jgi:hypothetical protein
VRSAASTSQIYHFFKQPQAARPDDEGPADPARGRQLFATDERLREIRTHAEPGFLASDDGGSAVREYLQFFRLGIDSVFSDFTDTAVFAKRLFDRFG